MSQKWLASRPDSNLPAFSFVLLSSFFFCFLNLEMLSYQAANVAQQTVFLLKKEKKQKLQWHRFACYICCEAQGSIKHLAICEAHLKEPNSCLLWKILDSFVCLYLCHWAKGVKNVVIPLKNRHALLPQWPDCWSTERGNVKSISEKATCVFKNICMTLDTYISLTRENCMKH